MKDAVDIKMSAVEFEGSRPVNWINVPEEIYSKQMIESQKKRERINFVMFTGAALLGLAVGSALLGFMELSLFMGVVAVLLSFLSMILVFNYINEGPPKTYIRVDKHTKD